LGTSQVKVAIYEKNFAKMLAQHMQQYNP